MTRPPKRFFDPGGEWNRLMTRAVKEELVKYGGLTVADSALEKAVAFVAERAVKNAVSMLLGNL